MVKNIVYLLKRRKNKLRIILEGCDGVGKTTLARILANKYDLDICHCTQNDVPVYPFYYGTLLKNDVVWDRHSLGELIYPEIFKRPQMLNEFEFNDLHEHMEILKVKIVVLTCDSKILKQRLLNRGNEHVNIMDNVERINNNFCEYAKKFNIPIIDTTQMTLSEIFKLFEGEN